jgi:hypothetical protein|tara:strand:- start:44 stop:175 length:132 start_codon:yes stop_codon:yes gene_type:complete
MTVQSKLLKIERSIRQCQANGFCIKKLILAKNFYMSKLKGSNK